MRYVILILAITFFGVVATLYASQMTKHTDKDTQSFVWDEYETPKELAENVKSRIKQGDTREFVESLLLADDEAVITSTTSMEKFSSVLNSSTPADIYFYLKDNVVFRNSIIKFTYQKPYESFFPILVPGTSRTITVFYDENDKVTWIFISGRSLYPVEGYYEGGTY